MKENNKKILIHTCCAVCSGYPLKYLKELGYEPTAYFFNPNIYPQIEYVKRLEAQKKLCEMLECELIVDDYSSEFYCEVMQGYENHQEGSERCTRCFELRLLKTIQKAKELGYDYYTTSLSISPHKNFDVIKQVGNFFSEYYNINFVDVNFKKQNGFLKSTSMAKEFDLYRQNYCGCDISMKRMLSPKLTKE